ncbi:MAG: PilZ domain-containing protein [Thermoanaerobaculia bacterium]|nr:PilZ domain-containing protein [Thermoanaerobaculia bacterium]
MNAQERRRFRRITLDQPVRGAVGDSSVYILDASVGGMRVAHKAPLPSPGAFCRVEMPSEIGPIKLDCEVVRTITKQELYQTGLQIIAADRQSAERLRELFSSNDS